MKIVLCLFVLLSVFTLASAQAPDTLWTQKFTNGLWDEGADLRETSDGGFIVAGSTSEGGNPDLSDIYVVKTTETGTAEWSLIHHHAQGDKTYAVRQTSDGGYLIVGHTNYVFQVSCDLYILKLTSAGQVEWETVPMGGSVLATGFVPRADGGYMLSGLAWGNALLLQVTADGQYVQNHTYPSGQRSVASAIAATDDGGYVLAGLGTPVDSTENAFIFKADAEGTLVWSHTYDFGYRRMDYFKDVAALSDGGFVAVGTSYQQSPEQDMDVILVRLDPEGNTLWSHTFSLATFDEGNSVIEMPDGGFLISGSTSYQVWPTATFAALLMRTDANGDTLWTQRVPGWQPTDFQRALPIADGFVAAGSFPVVRDTMETDLLLARFGNESPLTAPSEAQVTNYELSAYPNPFNSSTRIRLAMSEAAEIKLAIYDITGRVVRTLFSGRVAAGTKELTWDGRDASGDASVTGVYFCRLNSATGHSTQKLLLIR